MKRKLTLVVFLIALGLVLVPSRSVRMEGVDAALTAQETSMTHDDDDDRKGGSLTEAERIFEGFRISPVSLNLRRKDIALVGLGSYLVNTGGCVDCHSNPAYAPGGDPFLGQPKKFNSATYLAGGRAFGPVIIARNLTPDRDGLPAGLTWAQFLRTMRTGEDLKKLAPPAPSPTNDLLQVMPWPAIGQMTTRDLRAMYEYLRAIPSRPGFPRT